MGRLVRYPISLQRYLGRLWQVVNRFAYPLDPLRLVLSGTERETKIVTAEVRGCRGSSPLLRLPEFILPLPATFFDPSTHAYSQQSVLNDGYFSSPRPIWWPGERIVVEIEGPSPVGAAVLAGRKEFDRDRS